MSALKVHHKLYARTVIWHTTTEFRIPHGIPVVSSPKLTFGMPAPMLPAPPTLNMLYFTVVQVHICKVQCIQVKICMQCSHTLNSADPVATMKPLVQHKWEPGWEHNEGQDRIGGPKLPPNVHILNIYIGLMFMFILKNQACPIV